MKALDLQALFKRFEQSAESLTFEELLILLWNQWITPLDFVTYADRYKEGWKQYCEEHRLDFPRLIHALDFLAGVSKK